MFSTSVSAPFSADFSARGTLLALVLCALPLAQTAQGADLWVDPLLGDDLNSGLSLQTPLATVHHALTLADVGDVVHLAMGTYHTPGGETFPWVLPDGVALRGEAAPELVRVGVEAGIGIRLSVPHPYQPSLSRLTLYDADGWSAGLSSVTGVRVGGLASGADWWSFEDLRFEDMTRGMRTVDAGQFAMQRFVIERVSDGIDFRGQVQGRLSQGQLLDSTHRAINYLSQGAVGQLEISRCRFAPLSGASLYVDGSPYTGLVSASVILSDSLAFGGTRAVQMVNANLSVRRSTLAGFSQDAILRVGAGQLDLEDSILHAFGLSLPAPADSARDCALGGGQAAVMSNVIQGPAGFVDLAQGSLRLRFDSPCLDQGSLVAGGQPDLIGQARSIDGDLDLVPRADIGALEHTNLGGPSTSTIGADYNLSVTGPKYGFALIYFSRLGLFSNPQMTPYGLYHLPPVTTTLIALVRTYGDGGTVVPLMIPNDPALAGSTFAYQALVRSFSAPAGAAWSEPHTILVLP